MLSTALCTTHRDLSAPQTPETDSDSAGGQSGLSRFVHHSPQSSPQSFLAGDMMVEELLNISALLTSKNLQCINNLLEEKELGLLCYVL